MTKLFPLIEEVFKASNPKTDNVVQYWGFFKKEELQKNSDALLMLDIDFGRKCSLRCPTCFRKSNKVDDSKHDDLSYKKLMRVIDEAKELGLCTIKICGAGEPLENDLLLQFAKDLTYRGIGLSIFSKGHILGDDTKVTEIYGKWGIYSAEDLCKEFFKLKTSFLISFQSLNPVVQDKLVGNIMGYTKRRNRGIEILTKVGFNKTIPTRLAICSNPMTISNYDDLFEIYVFARKRNILPVNAALMTSGKQIDNDFLTEYDVDDNKKKRLFKKIYEFNIENGFNTVEQLNEQGLSCMPGIHPCNQIAIGLYLTCNGSVVRCPGDDGEPLGNINTENITSIWNRSKSWAFHGVYNCHCPFKDGKTLPPDIYQSTLSHILNVYEGKKVI